MSILKSEDRSKWVNAFIALVSLIVAYICIRFMGQLGEWFDLEAKIGSFVILTQAVGALLGIVFFVIIFKQKRLEAPFEIAGTGIFIRPLAAFILNIVVDPDEGKYEQMIIQHPIVRDYPENWQDKLNSFLNHEIVWQELPNVVGYVDQATNTDYRSPSWQELSLASQGLAGF